MTAAGRASRATAPGDPRVALITGATSGIGLAAAHHLAADGFRVVVHGRDEAKAERAAAAVRERADPSARVDAVAGDLSTFAGTAALADAVQARWPRLDVLVLNAGVYAKKRTETPDGVEETFMVNHLSQFLLVERLMPRIRGNAGTRIVVVASEAHRSARLDLADPEMKRRRYSGWQQYSNTKLMNLLFTRALAQRLKPYGVTVNALHPGVVATGIVRRDWRARPLFRIFGLPADRGARPVVQLAVDEAAGDVTGFYYVEGKPRAPRRAALRDELAEALWALSERYLADAGEAVPARAGSIRQSDA